MEIILKTSLELLKTTVSNSKFNMINQRLKNVRRVKFRVEKKIFKKIWKVSRVVNFMFLRKLKKKEMRYQTEVFLFLFFFSLSVGVHYFSVALLTIIRTTKQQGTQISTVSNINKITFMSSSRYQDETRDRKKEREEGGGGGGCGVKTEVGIGERI